MAAPMEHSISSAKKWGGIPEDYIDINDFLDSTKGSFPDNRHRAILHNSFICQNIIPRIFGHRRTNSDGKYYNTKDVAELHIYEDYRHRFIPSIQDYLENMTLEPWMNNSFGRAVPNSRKRVPIPEQKSKTIDFKDFNPKMDKVFTPKRPEGYLD